MENDLLKELTDNIVETHKLILETLKLFRKAADKSSGISDDVTKELLRLMCMENSIFDITKSEKAIEYLEAQRPHLFEDEEIIINGEMKEKVINYLYGCHEHASSSLEINCELFPREKINVAEEVIDVLCDEDSVFLIRTVGNISFFGLTEETLCKISEAKKKESGDLVLDEEVRNIILGHMKDDRSEVTSSITIRNLCFPDKAVSDVESVMMKLCEQKYLVLVNKNRVSNLYKLADGDEKFLFDDEEKVKLIDFLHKYPDLTEHSIKISFELFPEKSIYEVERGLDALCDQGLLTLVNIEKRRINFYKLTEKAFEWRKGK